MTGIDSTQIRRDLTSIGSKGSTSQGYVIKTLMKNIDHIINIQKPVSLILVCDHLHTQNALLSYLKSFHQEIRISGCYNEQLVPVPDGPLHGPALHTLLKDHEQEDSIIVTILAVADDKAQNIAEKLFFKGIKGFVNLSSTPLRLPESANVESFDLPKALTRTLFFAQRSHDEHR